MPASELGLLYCTVYWQNRTENRKWTMPGTVLKGIITYMMSVSLYEASKPLSLLQPATACYTHFRTKIFSSWASPGASLNN